MTAQGTFAYSGNEVYANNKVYVMSGNHLKYLCAALNCSAVSFLVAKIGRTTGMGLTQWEKFVVEQIPIVRPNQQVLQIIGQKVAHVAELMETEGNESEILETQEELDQEICSLYGLSSQEIKALHAA